MTPEQIPVHGLVPGEREELGGGATIGLVIEPCMLGVVLLTKLAEKASSGMATSCFASPLAQG
jgi:hypothetical protein